MEQASANPQLLSNQLCVSIVTMPLVKLFVLLRQHHMDVKVKIIWLITDVLVPVTVQITVLIKYVVSTGSCINKNDEFDYHMNNDLGRMVLNPDVVVRSRGVMEKCSMCIQMTQKTILDAKQEGEKLKMVNSKPLVRMHVLQVQWFLVISMIKKVK